mgnify:CR=1 FL=1
MARQCIYLCIICVTYLNNKLFTRLKRVGLAIKFNPKLNIAVILSSIALLGTGIEKEFKIGSQFTVSPLTNSDCYFMK